MIFCKLYSVLIYIDHRSVFAFKWYSSFVEFHISIKFSSDQRNSINFSLKYLDISSALFQIASKATKMTSFEQHNINNNSRMTSLSKDIDPSTNRAGSS